MAIVQPYAFKGDDFDKVYAQARAFLQTLRVDAGISVTLPDGFRSVTKYYPDWGQTMTVIEIFPDISVDEQSEMIECAYRRSLIEPESTPEVEEKPGATERLGDDFDPYLDAERLGFHEELAIDAGASDEQADSEDKDDEAWAAHMRENL